MNKKIKITVVGSGYVGMSLAVLLAQKNEVTILDINKKKVELVNNRKSTISDNLLSKYLRDKPLSLHATMDSKKAYYKADFIIVATPTDYDLNTNFFNTKSVDSVIHEARKINKNSTIVIKSTIPIGHTKKLTKKYFSSKIIFSPEFLREGNALHDNLYPSRIIIGSKCNEAIEFARILKEAAIKKDKKELFMSSSEAEAVKLFSNTYLAMRVAFFNELDSFALDKDLDSADIINGVCSDNRIGDHYNNPSFGYGGYCLPKDTKQLLSNYENVPQALIKAIVDSNDVRKIFLTKKIINLKPEVVGIFGLTMKKNSDNFRSSAIQDLILELMKFDLRLVIYEPSLKQDSFLGHEVISSLQKFKDVCDLILANRVEDDISDVKNKVFTRDLFMIN